MITFTFDTDTIKDRKRVVYWLGTTECVGKDAEHTAEIYEQLDAEIAFNL